MSRLSVRMIGRLAAALGALLAAAGVASAQPEVTAGADDDERDDATEQMVGVQGGIAAGGRTTPGGLELRGGYLYRLSEEDWLETRASFTLGGGGAACFRDREGDRLCDHDALDGFAAELGAGIRHHFDSGDTLTPFAHLGVALRLAAFGGDDLRGVAVPLYLGGGLRARVAPHVQVVGTGELRAGLAWFGGDVDREPHLSLAVLGGVEFELH